MSRNSWKLSTISWKVIAFWAVLWWLVYTAPTEGFLTHLLVSNGADAGHADMF